LPDFSVVIATHNRAAALPLAIRSVLAQELDDLEVVVVDDGSTDETRQIVESITDERVRYVHQPNAGPSAARNTGVSRSSGRFVAFLDDDDQVLPNWLRALASALDGNAAVASCGQIVVDSSGRPTRTMLPGPLGPVFDDHVGLFVGATYVVSRAAFDAAGGFDNGIHTGTHTSLALRLLPVCSAQGWPVRSVSEALVCHLDRPPAERLRNAPDRLLAGCTHVLDHHGAQLARSPEYLSNFCATAGVAAARLGDYRAARRFFARAIRAAPWIWRHYARFFLALVRPVGDRVWNVHAYRAL
jgi:glycosyltransferase involved in cell wall biosynthesis